MESFQQAPILPSNAPSWFKLDENSPTTQVLESYGQPQRGEDYLDFVSEGLTNPALYGQAILSHSRPTCMHSYDFDLLSSPVSHHKLSRRKSERLFDYGRQNGTARMGLEEYQAEYKAEQNARLLASRFALCEGYKKYRNRQPDQKEKKGKDGVKWPDHIEDIFLRALCRWEPCGRGKKIPPGGTKLMGRNELIADYIFVHTGEKRDRKQVSSHIQVIRPFVADEPMIMRYLATPASSKPSKSERLVRRGRSVYDPDSPQMNDITDQCSSQESAYSGTAKTYCSSEDSALPYDLYAHAGSADNNLASPINLTNVTGTDYNTSWIDNDIVPVSSTALELDLAVSPLDNTQAFDFVGGDINMSLDNTKDVNMGLKTDPLLLATQTTGVYDYTNIVSEGHSPVGQTDFPALDVIIDSFDVPFQLQAFAGADSGTTSNHKHGEHSGTFRQKDGNDRVFGHQHSAFHHGGQSSGDEEDTYMHSQQPEPLPSKEEAQPLTFPESLETLKSQDSFSLSPVQQNLDIGYSRPRNTIDILAANTQQNLELYSQNTLKDFIAESQDSFTYSQSHIEQNQSQDRFLLPVSPTHFHARGGVQVFDDVDRKTNAYPTHASPNQEFSRIRYLLSEQSDSGFGAIDNGVWRSEVP